MPKERARNTAIVITDSTAASRLISGRSNQATLEQSSEEIDVTTFGNEWRERLGGGLKDWNLSVAGVWDGAASQVDEIFSGILAACTAVKYGPAGSTTGQVQYSGCAILTTYSTEGSVEGAVTFSAEFSSASNLNRGTW